MDKKPELVMIALDGAVPSYILKMVKEGKLPSIEKLINQGSWFDDCRPAFPTITPTCWASLSTGTTPAIHGATCQDVHIPGTSLEKVVTAYHSSCIHAERFWEAAERVGKKSLIIDLPTAGPARSNNVLQIAYTRDPNLPTVPLEKDKVKTYVIPAQLFDSNTENITNITWLYKSPASGQWQSVQNKSNSVHINENRIAVLKVDINPKLYAIPSFNWYAKVCDNKIILSDKLENIDNGITLVEGCWTDVITRELANRNGLFPYRFRAKLLYVDIEKKKLKIFFTGASDVSEYILPDEFAKNALTVPGMFPSSGHHTYLESGLDKETFLEAEAMNFEWYLNVMRKTWGIYKPDISIFYTSLIDSINHRYRNVVEGLTPVNDQVRSSVIKFYEDAYKLADNFVGEVLDLVDTDTTIVLVSDHGSVGHKTSISPFDVLEKEGLIVYHTEDGTSKRKVDWNKTVAYPIGTCHVYVNLKGREPDGCVDKADYEQVVQRIIKALQDGFRDEENNICALAFALKNEEAGLVGLGGELSGDVVYGIAGSSVGGYMGGVHACQIPTAKTKTGDIRSLLLVKGPAFKKGEHIKRGVDLYDVAPTLCYALGYPQPNEAVGGVVYQALNENIEGKSK